MTTHASTQLAQLYNSSTDSEVETKTLRTIVTTQAATIEALKLENQQLREKLRQELIMAQDHVEEIL